MIVELKQDSMSAQAQQCRRLAHVLGLTKEMLSLAEQDQWDSVAEKELERRDDLLQCFSESRPAGDTELVAQAMAALLHLNEELMAKLKVARAAVMAQGQEMTQNRKAVNSYAAVDASL